MRVITQAANQHLLIILGSGARPREKLGLENLQTNWLIRSGNGSAANSRVDCPPAWPFLACILKQCNLVSTRSGKDDGPRHANKGFRPLQNISPAGVDPAGEGTLSILARHLLSRHRSTERDFRITGAGLAERV